MHLHSATLGHISVSFVEQKYLRLKNKRCCAKLYILDFLKVVVDICKNYHKCSVPAGCLTSSTWVHGCMGENSGTQTVPSVTRALGLLARVRVRCCELLRTVRIETSELIHGTHLFFPISICFYLLYSLVTVSYLFISLLLYFSYAEFGYMVRIFLVMSSLGYIFFYSIII